jgi:hypothetical protein
MTKGRRRRRLPQHEVRGCRSLGRLLASLARNLAAGGGVDEQLAAIFAVAGLVLVGRHVARQVVALPEALAAHRAFELLFALAPQRVGRLLFVVRAHVVHQVGGHPEAQVALGAHVLRGQTQGGQRRRQQRRNWRNGHREEWRHRRRTAAADGHLAGSRHLPGHAALVAKGGGRGGGRHEIGRVGGVGGRNVGLGRVQQGVGDVEQLLLATPVATVGGTRRMLLGQVAAEQFLPARVEQETWLRQRERRERLVLLLEVLGGEARGDVVGTHPSLGRRLLADLGEGALAAEVVAALLLVLQLGQLGVWGAEEGDVEAPLDACCRGGSDAAGGAAGRADAAVRAVRTVAAVVAT